MSKLVNPSIWSPLCAGCTVTYCSPNGHACRGYVANQYVPHKALDQLHANQKLSEDKSTTGQNLFRLTLERQYADFIRASEKAFNSPRKKIVHIERSKSTDPVVPLNERFHSIMKEAMDEKAPMSHMMDLASYDSESDANEQVIKALQTPSPVKVKKESTKPPTPEQKKKSVARRRVIMESPNGGGVRKRLRFPVPRLMQRPIILMPLTRIPSKARKVHITANARFLDEHGKCLRAQHVDRVFRYILPKKDIMEVDDANDSDVSSDESSDTNSDVL